MRPLVSVVCACFNISKYLDEAIASIYAQGYPNLELIVVDDGSTDDTYERLAMLRVRIPRHSDTQPTLIRTPVPRSFGQ
ncbi:glycosyltransferase, partial [Pseudomonas aeruginosa]